MSIPKRIEIEQAGNGFIVSAPWPHGPEVMGLGNLVATSLDEAMAIVVRVFENDMPVGGTVEVVRSWRKP